MLLFTEVFVVVVVAFAFVDAGELFDGNTWNDLRVRSSSMGETDGFYSMPRMFRDAQNRGYTTPPEEATGSPDTRVDMLCPERDPTVCLLFDKEGIIAGIEIGVERAQVDNKEYPFENHRMFRPKTRYGVTIYAIKWYFVEQAVLNAGGRTSLAPNGTGTGLWLQDGADDCTNCPLIQIPRLEKNIQTTAFTKTICVPTMGLHYFYNISSSTQCEDIKPFFALFTNGELLGFGYFAFAKIAKLGSITWFEDVPPLAVVALLPDVPVCALERATKYGISALHVLFVDNPNLITCPV